MYRISAIFNKTPADFFFPEMEELILKCSWNCKGPQIVNTILKKKNKAGGLTLPDFKTYYKATTKVIRTVLYWHNDIHLYHWNGIESPEISPYIYGQLILNNGWKIVSSTNGVRTTRYPPSKNEIEPLTHTTYKINSKWISDLNMRAKIIKLLGKSRGKSSWFEFDSGFLGIPKAWTTKGK